MPYYLRDLGADKDKAEESSPLGGLAVQRGSTGSSFLREFTTTS